MRKGWIVAVIATLLFIAGCGGAPQPAAPEATEAPAAEATEATEAPATEATEAPMEEPTADDAASEEPMDGGGVLRFGQNAADLGSLDPHFATGTQDRSLVDMVYNGLVRYKPGDSSVFDPDLAVELPTAEIVDGSQVWTFQLREGVMCHPTEDVAAYELTSDDVIYSLQKAANTETSAYASEYNGMTFEADGPYGVKVTLEQPISESLFLPKVANYSGGFIVCQKGAEALGEDLKTHPVGTGPFMFSSYSPGEKVELVANEDYFRGRPLLDGVEFRYMADLSSRELGLQAGQLDVINGAPDQAWVEKIEQLPDVNVDVFGVGEVVVVHFNMSIEPMDNSDVRKAIAYALDREEFLALFGERVGEKVYSPVPVQFLPGGLTQEEVQAADAEYAYNVETAQQLLADAGYPDGFSFKAVTSEMDAYRRTYESIQSQLAQVGIDMELEVVDHSSMHNLIRENVNPLVVYVAWRPNADVYLTRFFLSDSIVVTGAQPDTNFSHYDQIDDLILEARAETDSAAQEALWKEAQLKLLGDAVAVPLVYQNQVYARSSAVDYGHELKSSLALYPQITEQTSLNR